MMLPAMLQQCSNIHCTAYRFDSACAIAMLSAANLVHLGLQTRVRLLLRVPLLWWFFKQNSKHAILAEQPGPLARGLLSSQNMASTSPACRGKLNWSPMRDLRSCGGAWDRFAFFPSVCELACVGLWREGAGQSDLVCT